MSLSALQQANRHLGRELEWQALAAANSSNLLHCGWLDDQQLILRVNAGAEVAFGVDRRREAEVLAAIQHSRWAPPIIHNAWQQGWCLMGFAGQPLAAGTLPASAERQLLEAVCEWQTLDIDNGDLVMEYAGLWQSYREVFAARRRSTPAVGLDAVRELLDTSWQQLQRLPSLPPCLVHHDLHAGNLCILQGRLVILDWEYAGIGTPWFDAAALHQQFRIPVSVIARLPPFRELPARQLERGLAEASWLNSALELLWHSVRDLMRASADLSGLDGRAEQLLATRPDSGWQ